jgi:heterodisulfide reductase subunit A
MLRFVVYQRSRRQEHDPHIEPSIFYIDIRSFGKGFDPYIDRARDEQGVRYVRCMVSSVKEVPHSHNLRLLVAMKVRITSTR